MDRQDEDKRRRGTIDSINDAYSAYSNIKNIWRAGKSARTVLSGVRAAALVGGTPVGWIAAGIGIFLFIIIFFFFFSGSGGISLPGFSGGGQDSPAAGGSGRSPLPSDLNCYTSMTAQDMDSVFLQNGYLFFPGTGSSLATSAERYKINPAFIIAIGIQESALGNAYQGSPETLAKKNAFGLIGSDGLMSFGSWEEGADVAFQSVASYNCNTLECVAGIYAPIGAGNDPTNLNQYWLDGVKAALARIPYKTCLPPPGASGSISDWPIQKPISSCSITQKPGETFSHPDLNAVDISLPHGTPVYSTFDGAVTTLNIYQYNCFGGCPPGQGKGTYITITNGDVWAIFAHLIPESVSHLVLGQQIKKGDYLGQVDNTGYSSGDHLHYELPWGQAFPDYNSVCN